MNIVFVGAVFPGQFGALSDYLNRNGLAKTWFLTMPGHTESNIAKYPHLIPFQPDGDIMGPQSYYYSSKVERSARISRGILDALTELQKRERIDVVVAHSLWAAPNFLYDEIDAAIVSYIEFPSYRAHGWDPDFPPDLAQRLADRNMEMLHYHQVLESDLTIVPSQHAKSMFPAELRERIAVQFEGFDIAAPQRPAPNLNKRFTIGFAARDLSNAKGIDVFIRLANRLLAEGFDARFVALGDPEAVTYGYEQQWVERAYNKKVRSYRDHLLRQYPHALKIAFPGKLPYEKFSAAIADIDLFLYPLRYGVANWGLMEILARGGCVIAPNRGFAPELIANDLNGVLLPDDDEAWLSTIRALKADPARRARYSEAARKTGESFHLSQIAPRYMRLFEQAIKNRRSRLPGLKGGITV